MRATTSNSAPATKRAARPSIRENGRSRSSSYSRALYLVWRGYQRRAEVLAPLLGADLHFLPHQTPHRYLRPLDYLAKFVQTIRLIRSTKADCVFFQAPPHFTVLPALLLNVPYVVDAHNALLQSYWGRLPFVGFVLRRAKLVIVHNEEILKIAQRAYPDVSFHVVADPIAHIEVSGASRNPRQILLICSFDPDEPKEVVIGVIESMPEYDFVLTADVGKLSVEDQQRLRACSNLRLTGFLSTEDYHAVLCSSAVAVALTTKAATQQSGACEALSSDTPLVVSRDGLSEALFGGWAALVDNTTESVAQGIRGACGRALNLSQDRKRWNQAVSRSVRHLKRVF